MPLPELTEDEHAGLVRLLRDAIAAEPYRIEYPRKFVLVNEPKPQLLF